MAMATALALGREGDRGGAMGLGKEQYLGLAFCFLMINSYVLGPVRDAQVLYVGKEHTSKLILGSTVMALLLGNVSSQFGKATLGATAQSIGSFYRMYGLALLGFYFLLPVRTATASPSLEQKFVSSIFYMVSHILNLIAISVLWAFASDVNGGRHESTMKTFSFYALCCTIGQTIGASLSWFLLERNILTVEALIFVCYFSLESCVLCINNSCKNAGVEKSGSSPKSGPKPNKHAQIKPNPVSRVIEIVQDPYMRSMVLYTLFYTLTMQMIYVERIDSLSDEGLSHSESASYSSMINLVSASATFVIQVGMSSSNSVVQYIGIQGCMLSLPFTTGVGFASLYFSSSGLLAIGAVEIARRVIAFAINKPCREAMYSVVSREKKYAMKPIIDTFIYRIGSGMGALVFDWGRNQKDIGHPNNLYLAQAFIIIAWILIALHLSKSYQAMKNTKIH